MELGHKNRYLVSIMVMLAFFSKNSKGLNRGSPEDVSFINFKSDEFSYLNITSLGSDLVQDSSECGFTCLGITSCFSYNLAALPDINGKLLCELLPSDKDNNSDKFIASPFHYHFIIPTLCSSDPCVNGATCVAKYEDDDYQCACAPGYFGKHCKIDPGTNYNCSDVKNGGLSQGDGMYLLDPDGEDHLNAFPAYCDMTSYNGEWTMCYTTNEYVKPKTEVAYSDQFPFGSDGYRTNCNNIPFTEIMFIDHQTGKKVYFQRQTNQFITAAHNYGKAAGTYGLWDGVGTDSSYSYQLLICDDSSFSGFLVSGFTDNCYKSCHYWCHDGDSPFFRTASSSFGGVAFNVNGHPNYNKRLISLGLR